MAVAIQTRIKAETIAAAIYAATNIKPDVIYYDTGKNPLITFNKENSKKIGAYIENQIKKTGKSDVDIDLFPYVAPVVLKQVLPAAAAVFLAVFSIGYFFGRR